ncbi:N-6 DNA methylase [Alteromonas australica]|uniref:N-6 DNA methylase n=1 Tax=Alteromonas australica TaxID=589873 RepID=UPI0035C86FBA
MSVEKIVLELTSCINHAGLNEQRIAERELFLCLVATLLVNNLEERRYDNLFSVLFTENENTTAIERLEEVIQQTSFQRLSHHELFNELKDRLAKLSAAKTTLLLRETAYLFTQRIAEGLSRQEAISTYSHVLQRLQQMNVEDKLSEDFQYHDTPYCLAKLIHTLVKHSEAQAVYDPFALSGELAAKYAALSQLECSYTETVHQASSYLQHMLTIAGANKASALETNSLSAKANVDQGIANVAFALLEPASFNPDEDGPKLKVFDSADNDSDGRIKADSYTEKYPEHAFIQQVLYALSENGTGIVFVGKGPLHREVEDKGRRLLVDKNYVDAVIELPPKLITHRTVPLFALVLKKNKQTGTIKFVDASDCYTAKGRMNVLSNFDAIHERYLSPESLPGKVAIKTIDEVKENGRLMIPASYVSYDHGNNKQPNLISLRTSLEVICHENDKKLAEISNLLRETH